MRLIREIFRDAAVLDASGRHVNGSDRESNHHYGDAYERIFQRGKCAGYPTYLQHTHRKDVKLMLEIGVATGESLLAWREVFPNATIVGMDLQLTDHGYGDRIEFHVADQRKREDCERVVSGRQFDLIVDDASHQPADVMVCLLWMWPHIKSGGLYVIEDMHYIKDNIVSLFPHIEVVDTIGPFGGSEPLFVLRKK